MPRRCRRPRANPIPRPIPIPHSRRPRRPAPERVAPPRALGDAGDVGGRVLPVGVGGVAGGWDATELLLAGATAVQVGTATFADPRAPLKVLAALS